MNMQTDVLVIDGGLAGFCAALELDNRAVMGDAAIVKATVNEERA